VKIEAVADRCHTILAALAQVIVGKADVLEQIMAGVLANGHILIEDNPGLAKTLIARLVAQTLDLSFKRIQFTPDLLPSDITGSFLFNQREARFEFRPGRSSPTCSSPTRSTGPHPRRRARCWRRCRRHRSPSRGSASRSRRRSS
jgi:MoxR-like ATPase